MTSLDSIGSCSLDAYASSSEGTEPVSSTHKRYCETPKGHGQTHQTIGDEELSACTIRSLSALSTKSSSSSKPAGGKSATSTAKSVNANENPKYVHKTASLFEGSSKQQEDEADFLNIPVAKKPSYLGLACSLSGYSGLTSYDSKDREGFRTRDRSPAPPPQRPLTSKTMSNNATATLNGVKKGSTKNCTQSGGTRSTHVNGSVSDATALSHESVTHSLQESSRRFMTSMLTDKTDLESAFLQASSVFNIDRRHDQMASTAKDHVSSSGSSYHQLKKSPGTTQLVEISSQSRSFVTPVVSSSMARTPLEISPRESNQYESAVVDTRVTRVTREKSSESILTQSKSYFTQVVSSDSEKASNSNCSPEISFIQQRIERLYGPGALAQGFFSRTRQQSLVQEESVPQCPDASGSTLGSPSLPVLRHLRPEFRAQLPLHQSSSNRSPRRMQREMPSLFESPQTPQSLQHQTSIESISDSQPAAPDVPVLVGETLPDESGGSLKSPMLCKEANNAVKTEALKEEERTVKSSSDSSLESRDILDTSDHMNSGEEKKDGNYFLKVLRSEIQRLTELVGTAENELKNYHLPEEAQGKLRAASGQAGLLMKQKLKQFEGLCHKNINQSPDEVFPTTAQDLAGFWDMVKLQVDHVDRLFEELEHLKSNGWVDPMNEMGGNCAGSSSTRRRSGSRRYTGGPSGNKPKLLSDESRKASNGSRKKDDLAQARKRMLDEKRRMLRQHQQESKKAENIEIYMPHENGK